MTLNGCTALGGRDFNLKVAIFHMHCCRTFPLLSCHSVYSCTSVIAKSDLLTAHSVILVTVVLLFAITWKVSSRVNAVY